MKEKTSSHLIKHVTAIQKYIEVISSADDMHSLIVEGLAGWGKTSAVENALQLAKIEFIHLGAFSTPLNFYNFLHDHSEAVILIDDCASLFCDKNAMAILKAATWPSQNRKRIVNWGSTSGLVLAPDFEFTGKLIIVCNYFPRTPDGNAVRSRGYVKKVNISLAEAKQWLLAVAKDPTWFENTDLAIQIAEFLLGILNEGNLDEINFRTLRQGYRLAVTHPNSWKEMLEEDLPKGTPSPEELVIDLAKQNLKVKEQERIFQEKTGLKRRSFYNYRKELNNAQNSL